MRVTVNGRPFDVEPGTTLLEFLEAQDLDFRGIAVARNDEIVPRAAWGTSALRTATCWRSSGLSQGDKHGPAEPAEKGPPGRRRRSIPWPRRCLETKTC